VEHPAPEVQVRPWRIRSHFLRCRSSAVAEDEIHAILIEPKTTLNTGDVVGDKTVIELGKISGYRAGAEANGPLFAPDQQAQPSPPR